MRYSNSFDSCSKRTYAAGFAWNRVGEVKRPIPKGALRALEKSHKSLRKFYASSKDSLSTCRAFSGQLQWLHLVVNTATASGIPSLLRALNPQKLTTLILECVDYTDTSALLHGNLPQVFSGLKHLWIVAQSQSCLEFLRVAASNCRFLERFSLEWDSRLILKRDCFRELLRTVIAQNRASLKDLDLHLQKSDWRVFFPSLEGEDLRCDDPHSSAGSSSWNWNELNSSCIEQYGVPFERFSAFKHREEGLDRRGCRATVAYLASVCGRLCNSQVVEIWRIIMRWISVDARRRIDDALRIASTFLVRLKLRPPAEVYHQVLHDVVDLVHMAADLPESYLRRASGPLLRVLFFGFLSVKFDVLSKLFYELISRPAFFGAVKTKLITRLAKRVDDPAVVKIVSNPEPLLKAGLKMTEHVVVNLRGRGGSFSVPEGPLGAVVAMNQIHLIDALIRFPGFDLFKLEVNGTSLFDLLRNRSLSWPLRFLSSTHHVRREQHKEFIKACEYALSSEAIAQTDLLEIFVALLDTCVPRLTEDSPTTADYIGNLELAAPICGFLLSEASIRNVVGDFLEKAHGVGILPEDFDKVRFALNEKNLRENCGILLWYNLLRDFRPFLDGSRDLALLKNRLELLAYYCPGCPAPIHAFINDSDCRAPIAGLFDQAEETRIKEYFLHHGTKINFELALPICESP